MFLGESLLNLLEQEDQPSIIVATLDWGMGHAARCIPLIRQLQEKGARVIVFSAGSALQLLRSECPEARFIELPAYAVRYPWRWMWLNIAWQSPRIWQTIRAERQILHEFIRKNQVALIISDGRFGCYDPAVQSIWLAHQLEIQFPVPFVKKWLNHFYHRYLRRHFQEIWIPDLYGPHSLAGDLINPVADMQHTFIGPLSRFEKLGEPDNYQYDWLALLSGPEPQRSKLEEELWTQLADKKALIVRGVPGSSKIESLTDTLSIVDWLYGDALCDEVQRSRMLICRSGYSTLMDLHAWGKKALLIPTPGQTEQEYLATYWQEKKGYATQRQGKINLDKEEPTQ